MAFHTVRFTNPLRIPPILEQGAGLEPATFGL
jgi:hypothetical protein